MAGRGNADFNAATRRILGDRVGWRCSVPGCNKLTVGPGDAENESAKIGTAAHIHSAAIHGPRGRGGLTDEQLADISNGIWCCADHGREIDTNGGKGYTVETLRGWKRAREEAARRERTGLSTPGAGWVETIIVAESPRFAPGSKLTLGKGTVVESDGSIGKTSLYEWVAAAAGRTPAERWQEDKIRLELHYGSPLQHRLEYTSDMGNRSYIWDNGIIHVPPPDLQVVHVQEEVLRQYRELDDLHELAAEFTVDINIIRSLTAEIVRNGSGFLSSMRFMEDEPDEEEIDDEDQQDQVTSVSLFVTRSRTDFEQSFRSLATSEKFRVLIEFAAALARERARSAPTLLLIDGGGWNLSDGSWSLIAEFLLKQPFQTMITPNYIKFDAPIWQSWDRMHLRKEDRGGKFPTTIVT